MKFREYVLYGMVLQVLTFIIGVTTFLLLGSYWDIFWETLGLTHLIVLACTVIGLLCFDLILEK